MPQRLGVSRSLRNSIPLAVGMLAVVLMLLLHFSGVFMRWDRIAWDIFTRIEAGKRKPDPRILMVAVDQSGLDFFASNGVLWPWPRDLWGHLVYIAESAGAKGILFDVLFDDAGIDRLNSSGLYTDLALAGRLGTDFPTVIAAQLTPEGQLPPDLPEGLGWRGSLADAYPLEDHGIRLPHDRFKHSSIALSNIVPEPDGIIRWVPTLYSSGGEILPVLSLQFLHRVFGDDLPVPRLDGQGRLWLRYYGSGGPGGAFPFVPAAAVITGVVPPDSLKGKILVVGGFASGLLDYKPTPVADPAHPYPGFEIHATAVSNILRGDALLPVGTLPSALFILFFGLLGLGSIRIQRKIHIQVILILVIGIVVFAGSWFIFNRGYITPVIAPLFAVYGGVGVMFFADWHLEGRKRVRLHGLFSRYLDRSVIDDLIESGKDVQLKGAEMTTTVLFADMVGFTSASEKLTPPDVVSMLNEYYTVFVDIILEHRGFLDKFIGDAVMVLFGVPAADSRAPLLAAQSVLAVIEGIDELSRRRAEMGLPTMSMCVGVHTDQVVVGNIGHPKRMDFTAIGSGVNTASRLESANRHLGTRNLVSEIICGDLPENMPRREIGRVVLKGLTLPLRLYELLLDGDVGSWLADWERAWTLWRGGDRTAALDTWKKTRVLRPDDPALAKLIERLEPLVKKQKEDDDVLILFSK